jgi:hypothetical protein
MDTEIFFANNTPARQDAFAPKKFSDGKKIAKKAKL